MRHSSPARRRSWIKFLDETDFFVMTTAWRRGSISAREKILWNLGLVSGASINLQETGSGRDIGGAFVPEVRSTAFANADSCPWAFSPSQAPSTTEAGRKRD
ncbi:hypothetical protein EKH55_0661 [Sinorhizobium alkalisoli]|nr:hypothetical protein EKH55_0661 [Sinorhizobium alkalisoli]